MRFQKFNVHRRLRPEAVGGLLNRFCNNDREGIEVLGTLPPHETVTGFHVTPVLAWLGTPFEPVPEAGEVAEVFTVPLAHVTDPAAYVIESRHWRGQRRYYYAVPWGPYYIWGATARMLRALADRMVP